MGTQLRHEQDNSKHKMGILGAPNGEPLAGGPPRNKRGVCGSWYSPYLNKKSLHLVGVGSRGDGGATVEGAPHHTPTITTGTYIYIYRWNHMLQICTQGAQINTATGPPRMRVGSGWDVGTHILGAGGAPDMACPTLVTDPGGGR